MPKSNDFDDMELFCYFKDRTPNPGYCKVTQIDWRTRILEVTNGRYTYMPTFDEVTLIDKDIHSTLPSLSV